MLRRPDEKLSSNIRWWILAPCLGLVAIGCLVLALDLPEGTKFFLSGALLGVGAGGSLSEVSSLWERREESRQFDELRGGLLAQCRAAYRMGEFRVNTILELSEGKHHGENVSEFLSLAELMGFDGTLERLFSSLSAPEESIPQQIDTRVKTLMPFLGESLHTFYDLGSNLWKLRLQVRAADIPNVLDDEDFLAGYDDVGRLLRMVQPQIRHVQAAQAWSSFSRLREDGRLELRDVGNVLEIFHIFLFSLGLQDAEKFQFSAIISRFAGIGAREVQEEELKSLLSEVTQAINRINS